MKDPSLKEFSAQSKELKVPRKLLEVNIDGDVQQVRIRVKCDRGEVWGDQDIKSGRKSRTGRALLAASGNLPGAAPAAQKRTRRR
jgi:hypothetical protein